MSDEQQQKTKKTLVDRYWIGIILGIVVSLAIGVSIDVFASDGHIIAQKLAITDGNFTKSINNYTFKYDFPIAKSISTFLYSLSMSLIIALFILRVIQKEDDEERKREDDERRSELAKNVFKGVFDRLLPPEIYDVIKRDIFQSSVVRRNVQWTLQFKEEDAGLALYKNIIFEIDNLTSKEHIENFYAVTTASKHVKTEIQFLKWHEKGEQENTTVFYDKISEKNPEDKAIAKNVFGHSSVDVNFYKIDKDIPIPCNKTIVVNYKTKDTYVNNFEYIHDTMFTTACSSINWKMLVLYPDNFTFSVLPMFTKELKSISDDKGRRSYEYDGAILKGQGIEFTLLKE